MFTNHDIDIRNYSALLDKIYKLINNVVNIN